MDKPKPRPKHRRPHADVPEDRLSPAERMEVADFYDLMAIRGRLQETDYDSEVLAPASVPMVATGPAAGPRQATFL